MIDNYNITIRYRDGDWLPTEKANYDKRLLTNFFHNIELDSSSPPFFIIIYLKRLGLLLTKASPIFFSVIFILHLFSLNSVSKHLFISNLILIFHRFSQNSALKHPFLSNPILIFHRFSQNRFPVIDQIKHCYVFSLILLKRCFIIYHSCQKCHYS